jgi:hypothetical protein
MLDAEEYVEQAYYYRTLRERMEEGMSTQELLIGISHEVLSTTKLPMALQFMAAELKATGGFSGAMDRLGHYFTPFQAYVVRAAEETTGRFDFRVALEILEHEAAYRANDAPLQGLFFYQFETLCRNRLSYDQGLDAMAGDPLYDDNWREWLDTLRHQVGIIDFADMIFVRSQHYKRKADDPDVAVLFGEKEGKIALANRRKNLAYLFSALARHLGYPSVPRPKPVDDEANLLPLLRGRVDRMEMRIKILEEELRGGIDISDFYGTAKKAEEAADQ